MREFDALSGYPEPQQPRYVGPNLRTIHHKITACYRGKAFYDGDRNTGYGGFNYDGRWLPIADKMIEEYQLSSASALLQVNCEKGFLLHDFQKRLPGAKLRGTEISEYAIESAMP